MTMERRADEDDLLIEFLIFGLERDRTRIAETDASSSSPSSPSLFSIEASILGDGNDFP